MVVVADAAVRCPASLEEIHQREVDPLSGQRVDDPRTAGRADFLAGGDLNRPAGDVASRRTGGRRVTRHSAPITATLPRQRRRRHLVAAAAAASAVH